MALSSVYPGHAWVPYKFERVPSGYWDNPQNAVRFMNDVALQSGFTSVSDWETMSTRHLASLNVSCLQFV
jgi:hypothetical protein